MDVSLAGLPFRDDELRLWHNIDNVTRPGGRIMCHDLVAQLKCLECRGRT